MADSSARRREVDELRKKATEKILNDSPLRYEDLLSSSRKKYENEFVDRAEAQTARVLGVVREAVAATREKVAKASRLSSSSTLSAGAASHALFTDAVQSYDAHMSQLYAPQSGEDDLIFTKESNAERLENNILAHAIEKRQHESGNEVRMLEERNTNALAQAEATEAKLRAELAQAEANLELVESKQRRIISSLKMEKEAQLNTLRNELDEERAAHDAAVISNDKLRSDLELKTRELAAAKAQVDAKNVVQAEKIKQLEIQLDEALHNNQLLTENSSRQDSQELRQALSEKKRLESELAAAQQQIQVQKQKESEQKSQLEVQLQEERSKLEEQLRETAERAEIVAQLRKERETQKITQEAEYGRKLRESIGQLDALHLETIEAQRLELDTKHKKATGKLIASREQIHRQQLEETHQAWETKLVELCLERDGAMRAYEECTRKQAVLLEEKQSFESALLSEREAEREHHAQQMKQLQNDFESKQQKQVEALEVKHLAELDKALKESQAQFSAKLDETKSALLKEQEKLRSQELGALRSELEVKYDTAIRKLATADADKRKASEAELRDAYNTELREQENNHIKMLTEAEDRFNSLWEQQEAESKIKFEQKLEAARKQYEADLSERERQFTEREQALERKRITELEIALEKQQIEKNREHSIMFTKALRERDSTYVQEQRKIESDLEIRHREAMDAIEARHKSEIAKLNSHWESKLRAEQLLYESQQKVENDTVLKQREFELAAQYATELQDREAAQARALTSAVELAVKTAQKEFEAQLDIVTKEHDRQFIELRHELSLASSRALKTAQLKFASRFTNRMLGSKGGGSAAIKKMVPASFRLWKLVYEAIKDRDIKTRSLALRTLARVRNNGKNLAWNAWKAYVKNQFCQSKALLLSTRCLRRFTNFKLSKAWIQLKQVTIDQALKSKRQAIAAKILTRAVARFTKHNLWSSFYYWRTTDSIITRKKSSAAQVAISALRKMLHLALSTSFIHWRLLLIDLRHREELEQQQKNHQAIASQLAENQEAAGESIAKLRHETIRLSEQHDAAVSLLNSHRVQAKCAGSRTLMAVMSRLRKDRLSTYWDYWRGGGARLNQSATPTNTEEEDCNVDTITEPTDVGTLLERLRQKAINLSSRSIGLTIRGALNARLFRAWNCWRLAVLNASRLEALDQQREENAMYTRKLLETEKQRISSILSEQQQQLAVQSETTVKNAAFRLMSQVVRQLLNLTVSKAGKKWFRVIFELRRSTALREQQASFECEMHKLSDAHRMAATSLAEAREHERVWRVALSKEAGSKMMANIVRRLRCLRLVPTWNKWVWIVFSERHKRALQEQKKAFSTQLLLSDQDAKQLHEQHIAKEQELRIELAKTAGSHVLLLVIKKLQNGDLHQAFVQWIRFTLKVNHGSAIDNLQATFRNELHQLTEEHLAIHKLSQENLAQERTEREAVAKSSGLKLIHISINRMQNYHVSRAWKQWLWLVSESRHAEVIQKQRESFDSQLDEFTTAHKTATQMLNNSIQEERTLRESAEKAASSRMMIYVASHFMNGLLSRAFSQWHLVMIFERHEILLTAERSELLAEMQKVSNRHTETLRSLKLANDDAVAQEKEQREVAVRTTSTRFIVYIVRKLKNSQLAMAWTHWFRVILCSGQLVELNKLTEERRLQLDALERKHTAAMAEERHSRQEVTKSASIQIMLYIVKKMSNCSLARAWTQWRWATVQITFQVKFEEHNRTPTGELHRISQEGTEEINALNSKLVQERQRCEAMAKSASMRIVALVIQRLLHFQLLPAWSQWRSFISEQKYALAIGQQKESFDAEIKALIKAHQEDSTSARSERVVISKATSSRLIAYMFQKLCSERLRTAWYRWRMAALMKIHMQAISDRNSLFETELYDLTAAYKTAQASVIEAASYELRRREKDKRGASIKSIKHIVIRMASTRVSAALAQWQAFVIKQSHRVALEEQCNQFTNKLHKVSEEQAKAMTLVKQEHDGVLADERSSNAALIKTLSSRLIAHVVRKISSVGLSRAWNAWRSFIVHESTRLTIEGQHQEHSAFSKKLLDANQLAAEMMNKAQDELSRMTEEKRAAKELLELARQSLTQRALKRFIMSRMFRALNQWRWINYQASQVAAREFNKTITEKQMTKKLKKQQKLHDEEVQKLLDAHVASTQALEEQGEVEVARMKKEHEKILEKLDVVQYRLECSNSRMLSASIKKMVSARSLRAWNNWRCFVLHTQYHNALEEQRRENTAMSRRLDEAQETANKSVKQLCDEVARLSSQNDETTARLNSERIRSSVASSQTILHVITKMRHGCLVKSVNKWRSTIQCLQYESEKSKLQSRHNDALEAVKRKAEEEEEQHNERIHLIASRCIITVSQRYCHNRRAKAWNKWRWFTMEMRRIEIIVRTKNEQRDRDESAKHASSRRLVRAMRRIELAGCARAWNQWCWVLRRENAESERLARQRAAREQREIITALEERQVLVVAERDAQDNHFKTEMSVRLIRRALHRFKNQGIMSAWKTWNWAVATIRSIENARDSTIHEARQEHEAERSKYVQEREETLAKLSETHKMQLATLFSEKEAMQSALTKSRASHSIARAIVALQKGNIAKAYRTWCWFTDRSRDALARERLIEELERRHADEVENLLFIADSTLVAAKSTGLRLISKSLAHYEKGSLSTAWNSWIFFILRQRDVQISHENEQRHAAQVEQLISQADSSRQLMQTTATSVIRLVIARLEKGCSGRAWLTWCWFTNRKRDADARQKLRESYTVEVDSLRSAIDSSRVLTRNTASAVIARSIARLKKGSLNRAWSTWLWFTHRQCEIEARCALQQSHAVELERILSEVDSSRALTRSSASSIIAHSLVRLKKGAVGKAWHRWCWFTDRQRDEAAIQKIKESHSAELNRLLLEVDLSRDQAKSTASIVITRSIACIEKGVIGRTWTHWCWFMHREREADARSKLIESQAQEYERLLAESRAAACSSASSVIANSIARFQKGTLGKAWHRWCWFNDRQCEENTRREMQRQHQMEIERLLGQHSASSRNVSATMFSRAVHRLRSGILSNVWYQWRSYISQMAYHAKTNDLRQVHEAEMARFVEGSGKERMKLLSNMRSASTSSILRTIQRVRHRQTAQAWNQWFTLVLAERHQEAIEASRAQYEKQTFEIEKLHSLEVAQLSQQYEEKASSLIAESRRSERDLAKSAGSSHMKSAITKLKYRQVARAWAQWNVVITQSRLESEMTKLGKEHTDQVERLEGALVALREEHAKTMETEFQRLSTHYSRELVDQQKATVAALSAAAAEEREALRQRHTEELASLRRTCEFEMTKKLDEKERELKITAVNAEERLRSVQMEFILAQDRLCAETAATIAMVEGSKRDTILATTAASRAEIDAQRELLDSERRSHERELDLQMSKFEQAVDAVVSEHKRRQSVLSAKNGSTTRGLQSAIKLTLNALNDDTEKPINASAAAQIENLRYALADLINDIDHGKRRRPPSILRDDIQESLPTPPPRRRTSSPISTRLRLTDLDDIESKRSGLETLQAWAASLYDNDDEDSVSLSRNNPLRRSNPARRSLDIFPLSQQDQRRRRR